MSDNGAKRIRIGIDGHMIGDHSGGNESYYKNILQEMNIPSDLDIYLFLKPGVDASPYVGQFKIIRFKSTNAAIRNFVELPIIARRLKLDLLHTQYFIPFIRPCPVVCTIHDICFEHFKGIFTRSEYIRQKLLVPYAAKKSRLIFTVSEFSKRDIAEKYRINPDCIIVTYNAADRNFRKLSEEELDEIQLRDQFGLGDDPYILTVGNLQPRKNLPRLIEAFRDLNLPHDRDESPKREHRNGYKLVIVGKKAWKYDHILKSADDESIVLTDYVSESDLVRLYNAAELFVYPSFFEGFGIPPLEAMACGTPVIVSKASALPEVVGNAGMYFDPFIMESIREAMENVMTDKETQEKLINKGYQQAEKFSWNESARLIIENYRKITGNPSFKKTITV